LRRLTRTLLLLSSAAAAACAPAPTYDLVVANGRVIDPESGLDAVRHVGISGDSVAAISEQPLNRVLKNGR